MATYRSTAVADRIAILTHELEVLDSQRRGLVAELCRLAGHPVRKGSVTYFVLFYLKRYGGPATSTEILDFIGAERPQLKRTACSVSLYRAARRGQIVRMGGGWVLPDADAARRAESAE